MKLLKNLLAIFSFLAFLLMITALALLITGFRPYILKTRSMEPLYPQGSLCLIDTRVSLNQLEPGDVIAYRSPANSLVLHRLVDILSREDSSLRVLMQGDMNDLAQEITLSRKNYLGKEAFSFPRLGIFVEWALNHIWVLIGALVLLACFPWEKLRHRQ